MARSARPTPRGGTLSRTMSPPQPLIFSLDVREGSPHSHVGGISRVVRDDTTNMYGVCLELRGRVSLGTLDSDFKSIRKIRVPSSCRKQRNLYAFCSKVTVIEWSLNRLGSLNDLAVEPQQLQVLLEYVSSRLLYTPGSPCGQLLK